MNRTTVVFLALAILLAHTLAIHQTPGGDFAAPYERAHVAFRLGRNLVHERRSVWDPQETWASAYASLLWIAVSAVAELVRVSPLHLAQGLGTLVTLMTVMVLAQFSAERLAGLIAPVLFAASGATAAAAASGTEAPLALLFATTAYLAFERGWSRFLVLVLIALVLTRPEGLALVVGMWVLQRVDPPRDDFGAATTRADLASGIRTATLLLLALLIERRLLVGSWVPPWILNVVAYEPERWGQGAAYLWGFFAASATAPLLLLPVLQTLFRRLPGAGRRPLLLFLLWSVVVAAQGGDGLPFWNALAPALPLALLAIQTAITGWLDENPRHAPAAWGVLTVTVGTSILVSTIPGDLGPVPLRPVLERWMEPGPALADAFPRPMGRAGLMEEIEDVESLRAVGVFLRDEVGPDATIGTLWPGAIGYLSRKQVFDLLGRTQPSVGETRPQGWLGRARVDVVRALGAEHDYLVLEVARGTGNTVTQRLRSLLRRFDTVGDSPDRLREVLRALEDYEIVAVPVPVSSRRPDVPSPDPFHLLRHRRLGAAPRVQISHGGRSFDVHVQHEGHRQIVDLAVVLVDDGGREWSLQPTGSWTPAGEVDARTSILLYDTGTRPIRLLRGRLPDELERGVLTARLHSPGIPSSSPFATAGRPAVLRVEF